MLTYACAGYNEYDIAICPSTLTVGSANYNMFSIPGKGIFLPSQQFLFLNFNIHSPYMNTVIIASVL